VPSTPPLKQGHTYGPQLCPTGAPPHAKLAGREFGAALRVPVLTAVVVAAAGCHTNVPAKSPAALDGAQDAGVPDEPDVPPPTDTDRDGILDTKDKCPDEAEDLDGFEDDDGCPDLDNDHDRILDANDKCPNEPETYNGVDDDDGCPDAARRPLPEIKQGPISFDEGSAVVRGEAAAILDSMVAFIKVAPGYMGLTLAGHAATHERRPRELAAARTEAVRRYLVRRGVPPQGIRTEPFGAKTMCDRGELTEADRRVDVCINFRR